MAARQHGGEGQPPALECPGANMQVPGVCEGGNRRDGKQLRLGCGPGDAAPGCQVLSSCGSRRWRVGPTGCRQWHLPAGLAERLWSHHTGPAGLWAQVAWSPLTLWPPGSQHSLGLLMPPACWVGTFPTDSLALPSAPWSLSGRLPLGAGEPWSLRCCGCQPPHPHRVQEVWKGRSQPGSGTPTFHSERRSAPCPAGS